MDNPFVLLITTTCIAPLAIFAAGFWVGRGMPGLPYTISIRRRGLDDDWEP